MKKLFFLFLGLWLVSCSDRQLAGDILAENTPPPFCEENEFKALIEQARWGNGEAFLKLAGCYRDGKGVEKDLIGMISMEAQAESFGAIGSMVELFYAMPEDSEFRMIFEATELIEHKQMDEAKHIAEQLIAMGSPDGYTLQGVIAIESGDELEGVQLVEHAAAQGSTFAELVLVLPGWRGQKVPDMERLKAVAEKHPFVNTLIAKLYLDTEFEDLYNEHLAAQYYLKADEHACLSSPGARWLLYYHRNVSPLSLSERDLQRIQILARETEETEESDDEDNKEEVDDVSLVKENEPIE